MINDILIYILKYISTLEMTFNWSDFLQIAFLAILLLFLYRKFIKNTPSEKFVKGLFLGIVSIASYDIITSLIMNKNLDKKREKFYEENGF